MKQAQLKITAHIHTIKLKVRFPCSITASLRIQHQEIPYGQEVPLRLGQAVIEMAASHQFTVLFDSQRNSFEQKKISVLLFLKSSSGRIPAGAVVVNLNSIAQVQPRESYNVEKCPDKDATVDMSLTCECLNEIDCLPLNPGTHRSNKSDKQMRISFGNEKKRALKRSMLRQQGRSGEKQDFVEVQSRQLKASLSGKLDVSGNEQTTFRSSSKAHLNDYASKSKIQHLQRQIKNYQTKYEQQNIQLKGTISKKDIAERSLKDCEGQLRILRQKYTDLQAEYENSMKKNQFKDGSLREQLKINSQKLNHAEAQIQKMIFQKNDLVNGFEERQRQLRFGLRERQKGVNQDKIKLSKKLQQITNLYEQLKSASADGDQREAELTKELAKEKRRCEDEELAKVDLNHQVALLKEQLNLEKQQRKQLEEALSSNEQLEQQKKKFRKKIGELEQELNTQIKNNSSAEATAQRYLKRSEQLEETLKQKSGTLKQQSKEIQTLKKDIQQLKSSILEKQRKIDELQSSKQRQGSKLQQTIKDISQNLKKTQDDLTQTRKKLKQKQNIIIGLKQQMNTDLDDINNMTKKNGELQIQISQKNSEYTKLKYEFEELSLQKENITTQKTELQVQLDSYVHDLQELQSQYQSTSIQRQQERQKLQKQVATLKHRLQNSNEESSFQIMELQRKVSLLQNQNNVKSTQISDYKINIQNLEGERVKNNHQIQELEHTVQLKVNQIAFLNQSLGKANEDISRGIQQNQVLSSQNQKLKQIVQDLTQELQFTSQELNKATSSGSSTQQELEQYKFKNIQNISHFMRGIQGGLIQIEPKHQDSKILELMLKAVEANNIYVNDLNNSLQSQKESNKQLRAELQQLDSANQQLNKDFQQTSDQLTKQLKKNAQLNQNMKILEETFEKNKNELLNNNQSQTGKLNQKIQKLQTQLSELKGRYEEQTKNLNQHKQELNKTKKELKDLTSSSSGQTKSLKTQIQKLQAELQKKKKQIDSKTSTIIKYGEIQKQLRQKIQGSNTEITSLKEINDNMSKKNKQGSQKEKQLENQLNKLKEQRQAEKKKLQNLNQNQKIQIERLKQAIKGKEDQIKNLQHNLKNAKIDASNADKGHKQMIHALNAKIKQLQVSLDHERRSGSKETQRLTKLSQEAEKMKEKLEEKVSGLTRMLQQKQKIQNLEEQHLKPIREQLSFLKGYMAEYSKVGDQFQGNKNKLLKLSHTRLQQYSDRNVAQKLREVSFVFQKLKAFLLFSTGLNEKQKEGVGQELKKMQFSIDRSLRGDR